MRLIQFNRMATEKKQKNVRKGIGDVKQSIKGKY